MPGRAMEERLFMSCGGGPAGAGPGAPVPGMGVTGRAGAGGDTDGGGSGGSSASPASGTVSSLSLILSSSAAATATASGMVSASDTTSLSSISWIRALADGKALLVDAAPKTWFAMIRDETRGGKMDFGGIREAAQLCRLRAANYGDGTCMLLGNQA